MIVIYLSWLEFVEHLLWTRLYIKHMHYLIHSFQHLSEVDSIIITSSVDMETESGLDYNGQWRFLLHFTAQP